MLEDIGSGAFAPGGRNIQEQIAQALGVSRQTVQQALVRSHLTQAAGFMVARLRGKKLEATA